MGRVEVNVFCLNVNTICLSLQNDTEVLKLGTILKVRDLRGRIVSGRLRVNESERIHKSRENVALLFNTFLVLAKALCQNVPCAILKQHTKCEVNASYVSNVIK